MQGDVRNGQARRNPRRPPLLKVAEVVLRLNLKKSAVYALLASGALPHYRVGGTIRVSEEDLAAYLSSARRERGPAIRQTKTGSRPAQVKHLNADRLVEAWEKQGIG